MATRKRREVKTTKQRVFVVDDHPMVRERLAQLVNFEPDLEVCGEAEDSKQALERIAATNPDITVVDLALKDAQGLELVRELRQQFPKLPILVLSMHDETLYAERALRAGAKGYITKQAASQHDMTAIRRVLSGDVYVSEQMASRVLQRITRGAKAAMDSPLEVLSDRELEVFQQIGRGLGTREIAEVLHVRTKTVESYRSRIKEKLRLTNSTQVLQHAIRWVEDHRTL